MSFPSRMRVFAALAASVIVGLPSSAFTLVLETDGDIALGRAGATIGLRVYKEGWSGTLAGAPVDSRPCLPDAAVFRMKDPSGAECLEGSVALRCNGRSADISLRAKALADLRAECAAVVLSLPAAEMTGSEWRTGDGSCGVFPKLQGKTQIFSGVTDSFAYCDPTTRQPVDLHFPRPQKVLVQDSRLWGAGFSVRIEVASGSLAAGADLAFDCTVSHADVIEAERDRIVVIEPGGEWIPLDLKKNIVEGSAVDFSRLGRVDAPAGKHGWLRAIGGHFEFAGLPGVPQRFYGVNLCGEANYPSADLAEELVVRLRRLGYNSIRIHHHDNRWAKDADRLDRLVAFAFREGLYVTTDLYVSRRVTWREIGFERDGYVPGNVFKNLIAFHEQAFENWKSFACGFLLHENPYTGRRYVDEPGMPLMCLVNEGTMKWAWNDIRKMECVKRAWRAWRTKSMPRDPERIESFVESAAAQCFAADVEKRLFERQKAFLASLGCKALLTSQNCADSQAMASARECYDYVDNHAYYGNPKFLGEAWVPPFRCPNGNPAKAEGLSFANAAFARIAGKPYTITEWNFSGPGANRGMGGILVGAMASRQEWGGLWRFAYSHRADTMRDGVGAPHLFDLSEDALNLASDRAALCLFLRGDMAPLGTKVALDVGPARCTADGRPAVNRPEWIDEAWNLQTGRTTGRAVDGWSVHCLVDAMSSPPVASARPADFAIDREKGTVLVNTPCTSGGFTSCGRLDAGAVLFDSPNGAATIWASSLDGKEISSSSRILVTHLTDAQRSGNVYADSARTVLLKWGEGGTVVRRGRARVSIRLRDPEAFEVWGLATDGERTGPVEAKANDGLLSFVADVDSGHGARMLYEVARKGER